MNYGLTLKETSELAYLFAVENNTEIPEIRRNKKLQPMTVAWIYGSK